MKLIQSWWLVTAVALVAGDAGAALLRGSVVGNGGTPATGSSGSGRVLYGTAGQSAVGRSGGANNILCHGFWCFGGVRVLAVEENDPPGADLPTELAFGPATPNPSRGGVRFSLALPKAAAVDLGLFDVSGRRVGSLVDSRLPAGRFELSWDGTDASGRSAGSGYYFARLVVDGRVVARRPLVIVR